MRPSHQNNKRMRGRNRNGKGPNPLSRTYESNGPDVKIRGTAQHIAEKYLQLARDAQASGDPVTAESYLQHAEHYLRLIAAAHEQLRQANPSYRPYDPNADLDQDEGDEDGNPYVNGAPQPDVRFPQTAIEQEGEFQPRQFQPREQGQPREQREFQPREQREHREYQPREQREFQPREQRDFQPREQRDYQPREQRDFQPRGDFQGRRDDRFGRRGPRPDQPRFDRQDRQQGGGDQPERQEAQDRPERQERHERQDRPERQERPRRERPAPVADDAALPAFITAPVRAVAPEPVAVEAPAPAPAPEEVAGEEFPVRARRRRTTRAKAEAAPADETAGE